MYTGAGLREGIACRACSDDLSYKRLMTSDSAGSALFVKQAMLAMCRHEQKCTTTSISDVHAFRARQEVLCAFFQVTQTHGLVLVTAHGASMPVLSLDLWKFCNVKHCMRGRVRVLYTYTSDAWVRRRSPSVMRTVAGRHTFNFKSPAYHA